MQSVTWSSLLSVGNRQKYGLSPHNIISILFGSSLSYPIFLKVGFDHVNQWFSTGDDLVPLPHRGTVCGDVLSGYS